MDYMEWRGSILGGEGLGLTQLTFALRKGILAPNYC
jgi:hypothetical protein